MVHEQDQFLNVVDRDTAERRWWDVIHPEPLGPEVVPLAAALGRVLADDVAADVDVPAFDRSNVDGYALRAEETYGAAEETPRRLRLNPEELATGVVPRRSAMPGMATPIATGGMLPRGADAVLMVEHAWIDGDDLVCSARWPPGRTSVSPGPTWPAASWSCAGGPSTARETGLLAAIGRAEVEALRRPRVAILSTGDEVIAPGTPSRPASVYDANATLLADAVREVGGQPVPLGIVGGENSRAGNSPWSAGWRQPMSSFCAAAPARAAATCRTAGPSVAGDRGPRRRPQARQADLPRRGGKDPGGDFAGLSHLGDLHFRRVRRPGLAADGGTRPEAHAAIQATMALRSISRARAHGVSVGRSCPRSRPSVGLSDGQGFRLGHDVQPRDGFMAIPRNEEYVERGERVGVTRLGGYRCGRPGGDRVALRRARFASRPPGPAGFRSTTLWVGSQGGLHAAARGECDVAGVHLLDPRTDTYNVTFLPDGVRLLRGYGRMQGLVYRPGDGRMEGSSVTEADRPGRGRPTCVMVTRNRGSGTRILIDALLAAPRRRGRRSRSAPTMPWPRRWPRGGPTGVWRSRGWRARWSGLHPDPRRAVRLRHPCQPLGPPRRLRLPCADRGVRDMAPARRTRLSRRT